MFGSGSPYGSPPGQLGFVVMTIVHSFLSPFISLPFLPSFLLLFYLKLALCNSEMCECIQVVCGTYVEIAP